MNLQVDTHIFRYNQLLPVCVTNHHNILHIKTLRWRYKTVLSLLRVLTYKWAQSCSYIQYYRETWHDSQYSKATFKSHNKAFVKSTLSRTLSCIFLTLSLWSRYFQNLFKRFFMFRFYTRWNIPSLSAYLSPTIFNFLRQAWSSVSFGRVYWHFEEESRVVMFYALWIILNVLNSNKDSSSNSCQISSNLWSFSIWKRNTCIQYKDIENKNQRTRFLQLGAVIATAVKKNTSKRNNSI